MNHIYKELTGETLKPFKPLPITRNEEALSILLSYAPYHIVEMGNVTKKVRDEDLDIFSFVEANAFVLKHDDGNYDPFALALLKDSLSAALHNVSLSTIQESQYVVVTAHPDTLPGPSRGGRSVKAP